VLAAWLIYLGKPRQWPRDSSEGESSMHPQSPYGATDEPSGQHSRGCGTCTHSQRPYEGAEEPRGQHRSSLGVPVTPRGGGVTITWDLCVQGAMSTGITSG